MPRFDMRCDSCGAIVKDVWFNSLNTETHVRECDVCKQPMVKIPGGAQGEGVQLLLKGPDFAQNDKCKF